MALWGPLKAILGSEQGALGGDPVPTWEAVRAGNRLAEQLVAELLVHQPVRHETELAEGFRGPADGSGGVRRTVGRTDGGAGWFGDHQPAPGPEQGSGALGHDGRRAERAGQDPVEVPTEIRVPAGRLGAVLTDRHPGAEAEAVDGVAQEGGPAALGVE